MSNFYRSTKNPATGKFEEAAWLDKGRHYIVVFPDKSEYHEDDIKEWRDSYDVK